MPSPHSSSSPPPPFHPGLLNYTAADEDEEEPGFTEIQTVALACFLTLLPLMFGLVSYFGFRLICKGARKSRRSPYRRPYALYCWGRFKRTVEPSDIAKALDRDSSQRNRSSHALLNEQMKNSESQFSVLGGDVCGGETSRIEAFTDGNPVSSYSATSANQTSKATANGSIITMTMKNNHLIVETEVTENDLNSAEAQKKDDNELLVVEVAASESAVVVVEPQTTGLPSGGVNTGLSTSDLSCSSESLAGSHNHGYTYGTQQEYCCSNATAEQTTQQLVCHVLNSPSKVELLPTLPTTAAVAEGSVALDLPLDENPGEISADTGKSNPGFVPTPVEQPTTSS